MKLQPGETAAVPVTVRIRPAYHINSNAPADEYLIPTKLTWEPSLLVCKKTDYPEAEIVSYSFSKKPLAVYSNKIVIVSHFAVPENVPVTLTELKGEFRYQACNSRACLPPKTIEVIVRSHPFSCGLGTGATPSTPSSSRTRAPSVLPRRGTPGASEPVAQTILGIPSETP